MDTHNLPSAEEVLTFIDAEIEGNSHYSFRIKQLSLEAADLYNTDRYILDVPIHSRGGVVGKIIILIKRIFRKFTRWYYKPAFDYQNDINDKEKILLRSAAAIISDMSEDIQKLHKQVEGLSVHYDAFEKEAQTSMCEITQKYNEIEKAQIILEQTMECLKKGNAFEEKMEAKLNEISQKYEELSRMLYAFEQTVQSLKDESAQQCVENKEFLQISYEELKEQLNYSSMSLTKELEWLKSEYETSKHKVDESIKSILNANLDNLQISITEMNSKFSNMQSEWEQKIPIFEDRYALYDSRVRRIERKIEGLLNVDKVSATASNEKYVGEGSRVNDLDYFLFEGKYRGRLDDIKERQRIYLDIFKGRNKIVDCGCGRGEFVELLRENDTDVVGIDLSEDNVQFCQERQLPVYHAGIFEFLSDADSDSLGGIFCSQVVEHFTVDQLLEFINIAYDKLKTNAPIVIETINPKNVVAVSNWFYMDLTHVRPVHPETLQFVMESYGFKVKEVKYLHPDVNSMLPKLNSAGDEFNMKLDKVNEYLFGPQDYAIVAYKVKV